MRQTLPLDQRPRHRTSARERREANSTRAPQFRHRIATYVFYCSDCRRSLRHFGSKQFLTCIPSFDSFHRARMCSRGAHARSNTIALTAMQSSIHGLFVSFPFPHQSSIWLTFFVRELLFPFNRQRHDVIVRISGGVASAAVTDFEVINTFIAEIDQWGRVTAARFETSAHARCKRRLPRIRDQYRMTFKDVNKFILRQMGVT